MLAHVPRIAGVDEAGRGPLAGPVVAAAVILPPSFDVTGLNDSKKLSPQKRAELAERILRTATCAFAIGTPEEIDRLNVLQATMAAMSRAVLSLSEHPEEVWVDGNQIPPGLPFRALSVVKGDAKVASIAAASIVAKTHRDRLMERYALQYPEYGFDKHYGYPTPEHLQALRRFGPCPIHRRSFGPVAALISASDAPQPCLTFDA